MGILQEAKAAFLFSRKVATTKEIAFTREAGGLKRKG